MQDSSPAEFCENLAAGVQTLAGWQEIPAKK
jgi:23S rRNA G2445 N2-methylase RlmL